MRRISVIVVIVLLISGGFFLYQQAAAPEEATAQTLSEAEEAVAESAALITAEAKITPLRHAQLAFQKTGVVTEILVAEGEQVEAQQPLVHLDTVELANSLAQSEAQVARAEAALTAAQAQLETVKADVQVAETALRAAEGHLALTTAPPLSETIALHEAQIAVAQAGVYQASSNRAVAVSGPTAAEIEAAQADVAAAAAQERALQDQYDHLIRTETLGTPEEQARFALHAAEARLTAAQTNLEMLNAGPSGAQQDSAQAGVAIASAQVEVARQQLALILADPQQEVVEIAESGVAQAEANLARTETAVAHAEATVAEAEAAVSEAEAARDAVQIALDKMTLYAPFAGVVTNFDLELGEVVSIGAPVATLADLSGWIIETEDLTELDVVAIDVGTPVNVHVDSLPNVTLQGTVREIAPDATISRGDVTYTVAIDLNETQALPLRWGMSAFVEMDRSAE